MGIDWLDSSGESPSDQSVRPVSYQSNRLSWKFVVVFGVILFLLQKESLAESQRFQAARGRFSFLVPADWHFAPGFGALDGARFRRDLAAEKSAWFSVEVLEANRVFSPVVIKRREHARLLAADWRPVGRLEKTYFGSAKGWTQTFLRDEPAAQTGAQALQVYWLGRGDSWFRAQMAVPQKSWLFRLRGDVKRFLTSIRGDQRRAVKPLRMSKTDLLGRWKSSGAGTLEFLKDGRFALLQGAAVAKRGHFQLEGGRLTLTTEKVQSFRLSLESQGQILILHAPELKKAIRYHKLVPPNPEESLLGTWQSMGAGSGLSLEFGKDRRFQMAATKGFWAITGRRLTLKSTSQTEIHYEFQILSNILTLSAGDLPASVKFQKITRP